MDKEVGVEISSQGTMATVAFRATSISDMEGISSVSERIKGFIEKSRPNRIVFDFERVKFFSSQVLGLLLDIRAKLQTYNGDVVISAINPQLHRVFRITNLDKVFKFFPDKESAFRAESEN